MTSVTIVVPVLDRPHLASLFVQSARFSTIGHDVPIVAVVECWTDERAWREAGAEIVPPADYSWHTFAEKCNAAVQHLGPSDWFFFVGDDVRFQCGWLEEALRVADETGAMVVSTNDGGHNPHVASGERGVHLLINRRYIMERGASGDGPGTAYSEAYRHCCDVETAVVAQVRGVWAYAEGSVVDHRHVTWGGAPDDDTYREGRRHQVRDWNMWKKREPQVREWAAET